MTNMYGDTPLHNVARWGYGESVGGEVGRGEQGESVDGGEVGRVE